MAKSRNYQKSLLEALKDPLEAVEYLNAALEEGDPAVFLLALRDVVDSYGGMSKLAASTALNRENLYRMLSTKGNPEFFSLLTVLKAVGFRLAVESKVGGRLETEVGIKKIVLIPSPSMGQVKESAREYALAADTSACLEGAIPFKTADDQEMGTLDFDYKKGNLFLQLAEYVPLGPVREAELQLQDGRSVPAVGVSVDEKNRLVLLRKTRISPREVSQITLSTEGG
jgi:probable addiction module antidote protein